jgi:DNA-binding MarR family transcriptional regulator
MSNGALTPAPLPSPATNIGALVRDLLMAIEQRMDERMAAAGFGDLRSTHGKVFQFIGDGCTVTELAARAQMTRQSMAELVEHLEQRGYVERLPHPADRRARLVRLTARGEATIPVALATLGELEREWARILGRREMAHLKRSLARLREASGGWRGR